MLLAKEPCWHDEPYHADDRKSYIYVADDPERDPRDGQNHPFEDWVKRSSIHMPRRACRLLLEVTAIRVERLAGTFHIYYDEIVDFPTRRKVKDPWVWVVEFKRIEGEAKP